MRQLITIDKNGHIMGEFPHNPLEGFKSCRRGLRRRLVHASEVEVMGLDAAMALAHERYNLREKELRQEQFVEDERKRQLEYQERNMPVSEAAKRWHADLLHSNSTKTVNAYMQTMRIYLEQVGDHPLRDFSITHNREFLAKLSQLPSARNSTIISANTQDMHIRHLGVFLRWAYDSELYDRPVRLKRPIKPKKEMETYSIDQLQQLKTWLYKNLEEAPSGRKRVNALNLVRAFELATNCLLRSGAIRALPLDNIDLEQAVVRIRDVPELDWKNKAQRWPNKPINDHFHAFLVDDLANRNSNERWYLDDGQGNPWYADKAGISKAMSKACKQAGMPEGVKPFHWGMRAALITWLLNSGEPPQKVQQLADHASLQTTMSYYNTRAASQREAVDRLPSL